MSNEIVLMDDAEFQFLASEEARLRVRFAHKIRRDNILDFLVNEEPEGLKVRRRYKIVAIPHVPE